MIRNGKVITATLIMVGLFIFGSASIVQADSEQLYKVDTSQLNMRTDPSDEAKIVGNLVEGDKVMVFEEQDGWVKTFYTGEPVWVASHFLTLINDEPQTEQATEHKNKDTETGANTNLDKEKTAASENEATDETKTEAKESLTEQETKKETKEEKDQGKRKEGSVKYWHSFPKEADIQVEEEVKKKKIAEQKKYKLSKNSITITQSTDQPLDGYNIVVDAGHGGKDSGAVVNGDVYEKNITLKTANTVANQLQNAGATVTLTRLQDNFISLDKRVGISNSDEVDAFISIHFNAFKDSAVNGISTHYYDDEVSKGLANNLHSSIMKQIDMHDRGIRKSDYLVLRENDNPATLIELGFMTNPDNLKMIQSEDYQNHVALAIKEGLENYFNRTS
ncbi:N-acetylmuramoyl-L-alanine amidase [Lentibacillus sp. Marseille-P4043]|uniref:N-acetylmuramoyl-L-alanine amidase n=1 Tax=Lentibacillus sp. Marseille-P4043 TaxID=2040293 RepID=UPI000D0AE4F0|nr:N-acetylmuramoyl-L-alanine amidase [Lentibacillus sp. Marseille-P4043]